MSVRVNSEQQRLRVIAAATPVTHNILGVIPNKGCFPLPDTKTGTITSTPTTTVGTDNKKVVFGTGTLFRTEVFEGDYIYAADVCRKVLYVTSDTQLILEAPLPANIAAVAFKVVRAGKYKIIGASATGSANAIYQEATLEAGQVATVANEMGLAPVSYDVSAANSEITFELSE